MELGPFNNVSSIKVSSTGDVWVAGVEIGIKWYIMTATLRKFGPFDRTWSIWLSSSGNVWVAEVEEGGKRHIMTSEQDKIGPLGGSDFKPHEHYITAGYALPEGDKSRIIVERFYGFPEGS